MFWSISLASRAALASAPVRLTFLNFTGITIPDDFIGLSFEASVLLPNRNKIPRGRPFYLFSPTNKVLVAIFKNLGVKNLRTGGGTVDELPKPPSRADIDQLFGFAKAANVKVIFTFRLLNGDASIAPRTAAYIWRHYREQLDCFAIGNEPDWKSYHRSDPRITDYPSYLADWRNFADAIREAVPDARFAGPDTGSDFPVSRAADTDDQGESWTRRFADDERTAGILAVVTQHDYVGQLAKGVTARAAIDTMLSQKWPAAEYPALLNHVLAPVAADGFPFRMTESNDRVGGVAGASDAFASALWALDYLHWWAAHGCAGVNFHNNEWLKTDTVFLDANGKYHLNPKAFGIKAFELGGYGKVAAMAILNPDGINLTAYGAGNAAKLCVTVINKEHALGARRANLTVVPGSKWKRAKILFLSGRPEMKTGITLGGATIHDDGSWHGSWKPLNTGRDGLWTVHLPTASAVIILFSPE